MNRYQIENTVSGHVFGVYDGAGSDEAPSSDLKTFAALPDGLTPESVHYAQDGPQEQVIHDLHRIIQRCEAHGTVDATLLAQDAEKALEDVKAHQ